VSTHLRRNKYVKAPFEKPGKRCEKRDLGTKNKRVTISVIKIQQNKEKRKESKGTEHN